MIKYFIFVSFLVLAWVPLESQTFSFILHFEDAAGNIDSLELGYDQMATDSIDTTFGEINIITTPYDSLFDVRASDEWEVRNHFCPPATFHTKKQIVNDPCLSWFPVFAIDIKCDHWPVKVSWNSQLFQDTCRNGSFITAWAPGGWWDAGGGETGFLGDTNFIFLQSQAGPWFEPIHGFTSKNGDSISFFWVAFGDTTMFQVSSNPLSIGPALDVFPNPTSGNLQYSVKGISSPAESIFLIDTKGIIHHLDPNPLDLSLDLLPSGLYQLIFEFANGEKVCKKILKN